MPIPGAKFRVKTTKSGKKVRLAFKDGDVVEAKNLGSGAAHTQGEFAKDRRKKRGKRSTKGALAGMLTRKFGHR